MIEQRGARHASSRSESDDRTPFLDNAAMKTRSNHLTLVLGLILLPLAGCDSADADTEIPQDSHIRVLLTDAPLNDIVEAHVLIERVEVLGTGERITLLTDGPQPFDLLTLQEGVTAPLADLNIPDGTYTGLRLIVGEEASVLFDDGTVEALKIPSGSQSGIKIPLPALELTEDVVEVTIDFDVSESFVKRGNSGKGYIFKPVLKPLAVMINGEDVDLSSVVGDDDDG